MYTYIYEAMFLSSKVKLYIRLEVKADSLMEAQKKIQVDKQKYFPEYKSDLEALTLK